MLTQDRVKFQQLNASRSSCNFEPLQQPEKSCLRGPPCIAIIISRWGRWPSMTPLLLRSLSTNDFVDVYILSDTQPSHSTPLPVNVHLYRTGLDELSKRLQCAIGLQLQTTFANHRFSGAGVFTSMDDSQYSAARMTDLKPMLGEVFEADLLKGYDWWGHAQEDIIFGDLSSCLRPASLRTIDIFTPFVPPYNSSGVFMLLRNRPDINRLWRRSRYSSRELPNASYVAFDEWWTVPRIEDFSAILRRAFDAGELRISNGSFSWFSHDLAADHELVACWHAGALSLNVDKTQPILRQISCFQPEAGAAKQTTGGGKVLPWYTSRGHSVCLFHARETKRKRPIASLAVSAAEHAFLQREVDEFALTGHGLYVAPASAAERTRLPSRNRRYIFFKGPYNIRTAMSSTKIHARLQQLDGCHDKALQPINSERLGGFSAASSWCWRHGVRRLTPGGCTNKTVRRLCLRTCGSCVAVRARGGRQHEADRRHVAAPAESRNRSTVAPAPSEGKHFLSPMSTRDSAGPCRFRYLSLPARRCMHGQPCIAMFLTRWGSWLSLTPLLLRSLASNRFIDFYLLSDRHPSPSAPLPDNVHFYHLPLNSFVDRLRCVLGMNLANLVVGARFAGAGEIRSADPAMYSAAKTNDLKPMLGEAFEDDLLKGYSFWGHAQEDLILGDLLACIPPRRLQRFDAITPFRPPLNSSGVFMLMRNTPKINRLWRRSADAARVLSDPKYLVFDEWWGQPRIDDFASVVGRAIDAGEMRVGFPGRNWFTHDLKTDHPLIACWRKGSLYLNSKRFVPTEKQVPCFQLARDDNMTSVRQENFIKVCMFHGIEVKRKHAVAEMVLGAHHIVHVQRDADEFAITEDGVVVLSAASNRTAVRTSGQDAEALLLFSSKYKSGLQISPSTMRQYLQRMDECEDIPPTPQRRAAFGGAGPALRWCFLHAFHRSPARGCQNQTIRSLCVKTCRLCSSPSKLLTSGPSNV
uniref:Uncharacterized protein n=1 Tax=Chrysotila carterae TaxID=13221 RepID=A0A7S4EVU6_CHRCT